MPLWLVDRLFRNLLVDVTGNTHRAEICIDKLYSPDGPTGPARPGRVPLLRDAARRAHEPRAATAAARADRLVLARAAGRAAASAGARRCTTASCCRISSGRISSACSRDLRGAGYAFDPDWFEAQREFRFPVYGSVEHGGVDAGAAPGARALARARRGGRGRRHRALSSIARSSGCRCKATGFVPGRHVDRLQRPPHADDRRPARPGEAVGGRALQGLAAGLAACTRRFPCTRR